MKKGVLLVNLGSPESPDPKDVKTLIETLEKESLDDATKYTTTIIDECDMPFFIHFIAANTAG